MSLVIFIPSDSSWTPSSSPKGSHLLFSASLVFVFVFVSAFVFVLSLFDLFVSLFCDPLSFNWGRLYEVIY